LKKRNSHICAAAGQVARVVAVAAAIVTAIPPGIFLETRLNNFVDTDKLPRRIK
jgi:hypothetical protein